MRAIKFRARFRRRETNEIITEYVTLDELIIRNGSWYNMNLFNVASYDQFTGLTDKNCKEIYEEDILRCNFQENEIGVIKWYEHGFWIKQKSGCMSVPSQENREVVGNIYENPELLSSVPK